MLKRSTESAVAAGFAPRGVGRIAIAVVMGVMCLASVAAGQSDHVIVKSDATWRVTESTPGSGWNTLVGFDDSAWAAATDSGPGGVGSYTADYIWGSPMSEYQDIWMRKTFTLPRPAVASILAVNVDDDVQLWVNGTQIIYNTDCTAGEIVGANAQPYLVAGENLIAARATNCVGPAHFGFYLDVTDPAPIPALGPEGLLALAAVLAVAGALVIRRVAA